MGGDGGGALAGRGRYSYFLHVSNIKELKGNSVLAISLHILTADYNTFEVYHAISQNLYFCWKVKAKTGQSDLHTFLENSIINRFSISIKLQKVHLQPCDGNVNQTTKGTLATM